MGGLVERRWPSGIGVAIGYDAWFIASGGVYELGVLHALRAEFRYALMLAERVHPLFAGSVGAVGLGDLFRFSALGIGVDVSVGLEVELTERFAVVVMVPCRLISTGSFVTVRDRVRRADTFGVTGALGWQVGLAITDID